METEGKIYSINGPVVKATGCDSFKMHDQVFVGRDRLIGEVIAVDGEYAVIQVYESTTGIKVGEKVVSSQMPMSVTLGPGIIGGIFDGIQRPLKAIEEAVRTVHFKRAFCGFPRQKQKVECERKGS